MARRRHNDRTLYVVTWDTAGIIKIGFTDHLHRRRKAMPAARLVLALTFPDSITGYDFEIRANRAAFNTWPRAFASRTLAIPYLPLAGGGYLECYRASPAEALDLIASQCHVTAGRHDASSHCDTLSDRHTVMSRSYGRTDGLTETGGFRDGKKFRYVTRRHASRIFGFDAIGKAA
jgi:hypothetical protein